MKTLIRTMKELMIEERYDIDYHLPAEGIKQYPENRLITVSDIADVSNEVRDPSQIPEEEFLYVDIASIDISSGLVTNPQELLGEEAPSRARMVIHKNYVVVSTVRPTRGAIAVIPQELDNQICSTGFTVLKCKPNIDPYYLQFVLKLPSTLEQFRKFSTGSSYPAILSSDVLKTLIPKAEEGKQNQISQQMKISIQKRIEFLKQADDIMNQAIEYCNNILK
ncbi:MAG: hypothetical protein RLP44_29165 [Aggregatilineales bacterium]